MRRIAIVWFFTCLTVMMLLWQNVDPEGGWASTGSFEGDRDLGSTVVRTADRTS